MKLKVYSEIGKLKKVLVHRPGLEVDRLYPEVFERLLFDDIMYLQQARVEHDYFTDKLREEGVEVFYIEKLVADVINKYPAKKEKFVDDYLKMTRIKNQRVYDAAKIFFMKIENNEDMVNATIAGLKKSEVSPKFNKSLEDKILKEDEYPFYIDPIPNILFQRDPISTIFDGMNLHKMYSVTRNREKIYYEYGFKLHPEFKNISYNITPEEIDSMEGGDILVINKKVILIGISERTTAASAEVLAKKLLKKYHHLERVVAIEIPKDHATMHLDTVLTMMDYDKFSVDAEMATKKYVSYEMKRGKSKDTLALTKRESTIKDLLEKFVAKKITLIVVGGGETVRAKREQWNDGANCLAIAPGKIVVYNRNTFTNALIRKAGVQIIEVPSGELSRGRGGPRCMSMPLEREDI